RLRAGVRLSQRPDRILKQPDRDPFSMVGPYDGPVMTMVDREIPNGLAAAQFVSDSDLADPDFANTLTVRIIKGAAFIDDALGIFVYGIAAVRRVHPTVAGVEALVNKKLSPRDGAVCVQPLTAHHLQFGAKIKGRVRVDPEKRTPGRAAARGDRDPMGAAGRRLGRCPRTRVRHATGRRPAIEITKFG